MFREYVIKFLQNYKKKMKRPNFSPIFDEEKDFCEVTSEKPVETFVPNQQIDLRTLIQRFESGQRLNVHENFKPMSNFTNGSMYVEDYEDAPPDGVYDIVDVHNALNEHEQTKKVAKSAKAKAKADEATKKNDPSPVVADSHESNPSE